MSGYDDDLKIDHDALDVECLRQPELFMRYARLSADASAEADRAKQKLEVVAAELDAEIRLKLQATETKFREADVESRVITDKRHRDVYSDYIDKKHDAEILAGAVKAFQQRKDMITELIRLGSMSYYATPSVPRDLSEEVRKRILATREDLKERGEEEMRRRMQRRRRETTNE